MESLGAFPDGEWDSISRLLFTEEADFTVQCSFPNDHNYGLNFETSSEIDDSLFNFSDNVNSKLFNFSQESSASSNTSSVFLPTPSQQTYYFSDSNHIPITNNTSEEMEFRMLDDPMLACLKRKPETILPELQAGADGKTNAAVISENPKKRSRVSQDVHRIRQSKKNQKRTPNGNDKEEINAAQNGQTSSCYSSGDDSNASQELNGGATSDSKAAAALNLNGKTRANRGSATDPQSLYARKRREKINERLKILQNLVPNGTKVDISTMLEEAVHYVKFLQLQIKLLSSDDLWMYSPIAYNGMDIGLLRTISPTL